MSTMNVVIRFTTLFGATALAVAFAVGTTQSGYSGGQDVSVMADHGWGPAAMADAPRSV